jgi:hypothetical protein
VVTSLLSSCLPRSRRYKERGIVECRTVESGTKPAEEWRLIPLVGPAEHTRANEQNEQLPREVDATEDSSDSSYARDGSMTDPGSDSGMQVELF